MKKDMLGTEIVKDDIVAVPGSRKKLVIGRVEKICSMMIKVVRIDTERSDSNFFHPDNVLRVTDDPKVTFYLLNLDKNAIHQ